jgi:hypothetical protein
VVHGVTSRLKPRLTTDSYLASSDSGGDAVPLRRGPDVCVCVRSVGASFRSAYKNPQHQSRGGVASSPAELALGWSTSVRKLHLAAWNWGKVAIQVNALLSSNCCRVVE